MSVLRLLAIPSDAHGVGKFRIFDPFKYIGDNYQDDIRVDINLDVPEDDSFFKDYDVVVFHSFIHKSTHESNIERLKWLKSKGIKTIMDIDDFWQPDQKHPMYLQIMKNEIPKKKVEMLKLVDYVTTTTSLFADVIKSRLNLNNVLIFPNAVNDEEAQFQPKPTKSELVRFGWLGGSSHFPDIELMKPNISLIYNSFPNKVQFVLCGFDTRGTMTEIDQSTGRLRQRPIKPEETVWKKYEEIFTDNYKVIDQEYQRYLMLYKSDENNFDLNKPYRRRWTENINKYASNYNNFDVSLTPLVSNHFNSCKSQLKIIEAGFHKKAVIASDVKPYTLDLISAVDNGKLNDKGNALLVGEKRNHKDWAKHMKRLIENPNMIEDLGNRLYETVKDTYSLKNVSNQRVQFLKSIK